MNKFFLNVAKYLYVVGLLYLFGVWVALDWNILHWGWIGRVYIACVILLGLCVLGTDKQYTEAEIKQMKKEQDNQNVYDEIPW